MEQSLKDIGKMIYNMEKESKLVIFLFIFTY